MSIWTTGRRKGIAEPPKAPEPPQEKLPAQSLIIGARPVAQRLADVAAERAIAA
jgi:hypothetical protein